MKFSLLKGILSLVSVSSLVLAKTESGCLKVNSLIDERYIKECKENENGQVVNLSVDFSKRLHGVKFSFESLTDLKELDISGYKSDEIDFRGYYSFKVDRGNFARNGFKLPKNLEKIKFGGIDFTQEVINEVASLLHLNEIEFKYCDYDNVNLKPFSNHKSLKSVTFDEKIADNYNGRFRNDIIKNFQNIKKLTLNSVKLTIDQIKEISSLNKLEELKLDSASQNHLKNIPSIANSGELLHSLKNSKKDFKLPNGKFISKEDHFNRNIHQSHMAPVNAAQMDVYCELGLFTKWNNTGTHNLKNKDTFFTRLESFVGGKRGTNCDYRGVVGTVFEGCQFVYDINGEIVVNSLNKGTWDFCSPQTLIGKIKHVYTDVLPWLLWGNGIADEPEFQIMNVEEQQKVADIISNYKENKISKDNAKTEIEKLFHKH